MKSAGCRDCSVSSQRGSAAPRVREAERRATVGDLARQVNHDIKNGLIPLRNVMRHLSEVQRDDPAALPAVYRERRQTVDSSIAYLETLATSYARLSPPANGAMRPQRVDRRRRHAAQARERVEVEADLASALPSVLGDPIAFRRILENLVANAVDSLEGSPDGSRSQRQQSGATASRQSA